MTQERSQRVYGHLNYKPVTSAAHFLQTADERCCFLYAKVKTAIHKKSPRVKILSSGTGESVPSGRSSTQKPFLVLRHHFVQPFHVPKQRVPYPCLPRCRVSWVTPGEQRAHQPPASRDHGTQRKTGTGQLPEISRTANGMEILLGRLRWTPQQ